MGVSGSGKTTVGRALAARLGWQFADGDDFHSAHAVAKMRAGTPLTDEDRAPWLAAIRDAMTGWTSSDTDTVLACSALKGTYRHALAMQGVRFVFLDVDEPTLAARMKARDHFMPPSLLQSQLATLEVPSAKEALRVDAARPIDDVVREIAAAL
ncbi:MAG: gluconokinase [Polyangia bacterium]